MSPEQSEYTRHLQSRGLSRNSIASYMTDVAQWLRWLAMHSISNPNRAVVEEYLVHRGVDCGDAPATLSHKITSIRSYYDHVLKSNPNDSLAVNPWEDISKPHLPPRLPNVLTHEQCLALILQPMRSWRSKYPQGRTA